MWRATTIDLEGFQKGPEEAETKLRVDTVQLRRLRSLQVFQTVREVVPTYVLQATRASYFVTLELDFARPVHCDVAFAARHKRFDHAAANLILIVLTYRTYSP